MSIRYAIQSRADKLARIAEGVAPEMAESPDDVRGMLAEDAAGVGDPTTGHDDYVKALERIGAACVLLLAIEYDAGRTHS